MVISCKQVFEEIEGWIVREGLDVEFFHRYPEHDITHNIMGLSTIQEGIAITVEEILFETLTLPTLEVFFNACAGLQLSTDSYGYDDIVLAYTRLLEVFPISFND